MDLAKPILDRFKKKQVPNIEPGDVVRVHQKISEGGKERIQVFEGIVIATHEKNSLDATFTVRKIASGVGVERTYLLHSPNVVKIEFKKSSKVRRSKLYYLRSLVGKALRMKDKKGVLKDNWELVAEDDKSAEPTEEDIAEAVEADKIKKEEAAEASESQEEQADEPQAQEQEGGEKEAEKTDESNNNNSAPEQSEEGSGDADKDPESSDGEGDTGEKQE